MLTFEELCERAKQLDEVTLMELLRLTSDDLVERFKDVIEDRYDEFMEELGGD